MRWHDLFADLEAQAAALAVASRDAEVDERIRFEYGRLALVDRLRPSVGAQVSLRCLGGLSLIGELGHVGSEWLLVTEAGGRESLVALGGLTWLTGVGWLSAGPDSLGAVESRLGLAHALRGVARDRAVLRMHLRDGSVVDGTIDRVGSNFVEVATHPTGERRRRGVVRGVAVVATDAIAVVRKER